MPAAMARQLAAAAALAMATTVASAAAGSSASGSEMECIGNVTEMMRGRSLASVQMKLATGKNLPYDSGKYEVCKNIEVAYAMPTKFFIVNFLLRMSSGFLPGEVGVCLPAACEGKHFESLREIISLGNNSIAHFAQNVAFSKQDTGDWPAPPGTVSYTNPFNNQDDRKPWNTGATVAASVALALAALVCCATSAVVLARRPEAQEAGPPATALLPLAAPQESNGEGREAGTGRLPRRLAFCEAFSLVGPTGTWTALWKAETARPTDCLNGMRVICMFFIVLGHSLLEPMGISGYSNAECIAKTPFCLNAADTNMWTYLLLVGQLGVDTFFFIAGFLLSFVGKSRSAPILMGTALRYARLLPLFGFVMMLYVLVSPYLVFGPFSPRMQNNIFTDCGDNTWWSELLFINAFYPWFTNNGGCMGWSWYLGVDMVFAILGLVLLSLWKKLPTIAWVCAGVLFFASIAVTIQQSLHYKLEYNVISPSFGVYGHYLYSRPYTRLPGFLIGLTAPWALDALERLCGLRRGTQAQSCAARLAVFLACLGALVLAAVCIFLPFWNGDGPGPPSTARKALEWTPWQNAWWIALNRPAWASCFLVWTLACYFDYVPMVNSALSHRMWTPLSSLTYGAYLVHPVIIKVVVGNAESYYTYSPIDALQRALFFAVLSYSASAVLWCMVEKPLATMTCWLIPKRG